MPAEIRIIVSSTSTGSALAQAKQDVRDLGDVAEKSGGGFSSLREVATGALRAVGEAAIHAFTSAASAAAGFIKDSVKVAGDFEAGMNSFAASAGGALESAGLKVEDFRDLFLSLGKKLPVSTREVQAAAEALVKGGLDPAILAAGGLESSLTFASAAGMGLEEAAELGVKMLGTFVPITASAAEQTEFLAHAQDLLVKAAGASTLNVDKLGDAMLQAGGQARAMGLDYEDFVTSMGLISPAFGSAAEAGTSFKNFLVRLQPSTEKAKDTMIALGLATEDGTSKFFDAQGKFVGTKKAAGLLQKALGGLTDSERVMALQTIFGNDAMGAASALMAGGEEAYDKFKQKMEEASGVQAQAQTVQQGYNIALDNFKGSIEAAQITLGTKLLPVLTRVLNEVLAPTVNILGDLIDKGKITKETFDGLTPTMQGIVSAIGDIIDKVSNPSVALINFFYQVLPPQLAGTLTDGLLQVRDALYKVFAIFASGNSFAANAVNIFYALLPADMAERVTDMFMSIRDGIDAGMAILAGDESLGTLSRLITDSFNVFGPELTLALGAAFVAVQGFVANVAAAFSDGGIVGAAQVVIDKLAEISPGFAVLKGVVEAALPPLVTIVQSVFDIIVSLIRDHGAQMLADVQGVWTGIWTSVQTILPPLQEFIRVVFDQIALFLQLHGTEISAFIATTWNAIAEIIRISLEITSLIVSTTLAAIAAFITEHGTTIQAILTNTWNAIQAIINIALGVIKGMLAVTLAILKGDWQGAWTAMEAMGRTVWENIRLLFTAWLNNIKITWEIVWNAVKAFFEGIMNSIVGWVIQTMQGIVNAVAAFADEARGAAGSVASAIVSGITSGIENGASAIIGAAKRAALAALDAAKSALGISSPSKVFAMEVGKPMAQGMALGLTGSAPLVAGAAAQTAGAAVTGGRSAASNTYSRVVNYSPTYNGVSAPPEWDSALASVLAGV